MLLFLFGFFTGYVILIIAREAWKWKPLTNKKKRRAKDNGLSGDFDVDRAKLEDTANDDQCKSSSSKRLSDKYIFEAYQERTLNFLYKLNFLRKEKQFCDVKIITEDGKEIWAHKNVLSSNCEYFERMFSGTFKESNLYEVIIKHIPNDVLEEIISFIYTSQLAITEQNVENLLVASNFMLLDDVCQSCEEYLKNLTTPENCIDILKIADDHNLNGLQKFCMSYAMDHFEFLATTTSFLNSPLHQIKYLIANDNLCAKEETVCSAVINWVKSFEETRLKDLPGLLHYVRFTLISSDYLKNIMKSEPIIYSNPKCTYYFFEAFAWHSQIIERKLSNLADTFQRKPLKKCLVVIADNYCNYTEYPYSYVEWYDYVTCQWIKHRTTWKPPFMDPRYYVLDNCSLLAIGGRNLNGDAIKTVRVFDSKSTRWHHMTDMNCRRHDPGVVQFGNRLYVIGGCRKFDKEVQRGGEYYDMCTGKWHCIQRMVHGRESFGIGVINDHIYVVGGHGIGIFTSGERYDPRSNTWSPIPSMPICRDGPFICFLNKQIYVIGGWVGGSCSKSADVFDTSTNKWKSIADMEYGRSYASGGILNGQIYVIGGISGAINDGSRMILNTTEVYDPSKNKWSLAKGVLSEDTAQRRHIGLVCDRSVSFLRKSIKSLTI